MSGRPAETREWPDLAVVVLAVGAPPELVEAVASVVGQRPRPEVVVVNSGGGDALVRLTGHGLAVPVVEVGQRLPTGAARNAGIAATRAPYVAFLAADNRAERGWVAARLASHRAGAPAVASAMVNPFPRSLAARAAHLSLHVRRWPAVPAALALPYGASYARDLLARHGGFRADLARGEDSELLARLAPSEQPCWNPAVRTADLYPRSFGALVAEHWRRGAHAVEAHAALPGGPGAAAIARNALGRLRPSMTLAWSITPAAERSWLVASWALLPAAAAAYAAGALSARRPAQ